MPAPANITERFDEFPAHPLAIPNKRGGAKGMGNGDVVQYFNGRPVRMDEALSDGDALCTLANGERAILKWNNLRPWATK